mgnify:FL=1
MRKFVRLPLHSQAGTRRIPRPYYLYAALSATNVQTSATSTATWSIANTVRRYAANVPKPAAAIPRNQNHNTNLYKKNSMMKKVTLILGTAFLMFACNSTGDQNNYSSDSLQNNHVNSDTLKNNRDTTYNNRDTTYNSGDTTRKRSDTSQRQPVD